jgi:hypothetical protein
MIIAFFLSPISISISYMTLLSPSSFIRPRTLHQRGYVAKPRGFLWLSHLSCSQQPFCSRSNQQQKEQPFCCRSNQQQKEQPFCCRSNQQQKKQPFCCRSNHQQREQPSQRKQPSAEGETISSGRNYQLWEQLSAM